MIYFARWKDGSFSLVDAEDEDEAFQLLDEFGDEPAELSALDSCLIDFELTDSGAFRLRAFGEVMKDEIMERGYPLLQLGLQRVASEEYDPEDVTGDVPKEVAAAVAAERERLASFQPAEASTELGKGISDHANISGRNIDAVIRRKAAARLANLAVDKHRKPQ